MNKIWIKQVKATRDDGTTSTVDFVNGFNLVIGPSNTGKTRIAKTIAYACGADYQKRKPFTKKTGYTKAYVTFVTPRGEITIEREVKQRGKITVTSTDTLIPSGSYSLDRKSKMPLNTALLAMLGISASRRMLRNEGFEQVAFTWDSIQHLLLVPEGQIGRDEPSILFQESLNNTTVTLNLSMLLIMMQDENFDHDKRQETATERRTRRRAVERFLYEELDGLEKLIQQAEEAEKIAKAQATTVAAYMKQLQIELAEIMQQRQDLIENDRNTVSRMTRTYKDLSEHEVLLTQRRALVSQYQADVARLDLQLQVMNHDRRHPQIATCQFCNSTIDAPETTIEELANAEKEIQRIRVLEEGANSDINAISAQTASLRALYQEDRKVHQENQHILTSQLKPAETQLTETISRLTKAQEAKAKLAELYARRAQYKSKLDELEEPPEEVEKYKPRELFEPDFFYSMSLNLREIFTRAHFEGAESADFNRQTFDVTVGGYTKADEQGKGYSAFFNTIVMLAFHDYMNKRSPNAPGFLLIDTPFHGFDQGNLDAGHSMKGGLLAYMAEQAKDQQIIILENTDKVEGMDLARFGNLIEFTHETSYGRYGYLDDVYDVGKKDDGE